MKAPVTESREGGEFKLVSPGVHVAVYETFAYLGEQPKSWAGESWMAPECFLRWAVMDEFTDEGKPLAIHAFPYTFNMGQKANLRKVIEASFGKQFPSDHEAGQFDFSKLLGKACQICVAHTQKGDKTYAKITSWMPLPQGMQKPDVSKVETIYYDEENLTQFDKLPQWIRKKINNAGQQQPQYNPVSGGTVAATNPPQTIEEFDDSDIPF